MCAMWFFKCFYHPLRAKLKEKGGTKAKDQKFHLLEVTWRKQFSTSKQISFHHNGKSVNQSKSPFCGFFGYKEKRKEKSEETYENFGFVLSSCVARLVRFFFLKKSSKTVELEGKFVSRLGK
jgi:hypothetical protein